MKIKIISTSIDFPDYFFNQYVGMECEVVREGLTNTKGKISNLNEPCYCIKTGLSEISIIQVPKINAQVINTPSV
jgi:hypothetical protein